MDNTKVIYDDSGKFVIGPGDCILSFSIVSFSDYSHFNENYKVIVIDLSKHVLVFCVSVYANSRIVEQVNSAVNLDEGARAIFAVLEEVKETSSDF